EPRARNVLIRTAPQTSTAHLHSRSIGYIFTPITSGAGIMRVHVKTCVLPLLLSAVSFGQTFYGSIIGMVTDPTGSSVPTAVVTLTNIGTSDRRTAATDSAGNYHFTTLFPGQSKPKTEPPGSRRFVREPITVEVQSAVRIDVPLSVGDVTQTVEVSGQIALIQTENASLGQVVDARKVL